MKKSTISAWFGLAVSVTPAFGSGYIMLDNYNTCGPDITYPFYLGGQGLRTGGWGGGWGGPWTVGLYYTMGDVTKYLSPNPNSWDDPGDWGFGFTLGTGPGAIATICDSAFDTPGEFMAYSPFEIAGNPGDTVTVVIIAYDGASYAAAWPKFPFDNFPWGSAARGHSEPFTMTLGDIYSADKSVGYFMQGFSVYMAIPEPGMLALGSLGSAVLMVARRRMRSCVLWKMMG